LSNSANIRNIDSLKNLKKSIIHFGENGNFHLIQLELSISRELDYLDSIETKLFQDLNETEDDLEEAIKDLEYCERTCDYDDDDCCHEENVVAECRRNFKIAEAKYNQCRMWIQRVQNQLGSFNIHKSRFKRLINNHKENTTGSLSRLINGAETYESIKTPTSNTSFAKSGISNNSSIIVSKEINRVSVDNSKTTFKDNANNDYLIESNTLAANQVGVFVSQKDKSISGGFRCGLCRIEEKSNGRFAKICDIVLPPKYQNIGIEKNILIEMEKVAVNNNCSEIYGWADSNVLGFYKKQGYHIRNEIPNAGGEVYKSFENKNNFKRTQEIIKETFSDFNEKFIKKEIKLDSPKLVSNIDPSRILTPEMDTTFWNHHGNNKSDYVSIADKISEISNQLDLGLTIDKISTHNESNKQIISSLKNNPIRLIKCDDYYMIDEDGRHRVAAAQLLTKQKENVRLIAEVRETI